MRTQIVRAKVAVGLRCCQILEPGRSVRDSLSEDLSIPRLQTKSQAWDAPNEGLFMAVEEIVTEAGST